MGLTTKKVYAILKKKIGAMEEQTKHPIRYKGSVNSALELPGNPEIGDMYNISQKSIYGEAGMNVAWNGVVWDTMGASIDMSLYFTKEEADATIQNMVNEYFKKNPVKPGATAEQEQQIDQNKTDIASLKVGTNSLKEDKVDKPSIADDGKTPRAKNGNVEWVEQGLPSDTQTETAVNNWLNEHPEATTTVQDNSLTINKMVVGTLGYVTPEMFGAKGDGITDDTEGIAKCFESNNTVVLLTGKYIVNEKMFSINNKTIICGEESKIIIGEYLTNYDDIFMITGKNFISGLSVTVVSNSHAKHLLTFRDCQNSHFENMHLKVENSDAYQEASCSPIDINSNNNNLSFKNCSFLQMANQSKGGCWIRESKSGGTSSNITFDNCTFIKQNGDEVIAVWGWKGSVENVRFNNCFMEVLNSKHTPYYIITMGQDGKCKDCELNGCIVKVEKCRNGILNTLYINDAINNNGNIYINNCKFIVNLDENVSTKSLFGSVTVAGNKHIYNNCEFIFKNTIKMNRSLFECCIVKNSLIKANAANVFNTCTIINNDVYCSDCVLCTGSPYIERNRFYTDIISNKSIIEFSKVYDDAVIFKDNFIKCTGETESIFAQIKNQDIKNTLYFTNNILNGVCIWISGAEMVRIVSDIYEHVNKRRNISGTSVYYNYIDNGIPQTSE